ncbi:MAG: NPCBM/NEW2 domain-containing protein [Pirellulales bacterium]|nr:NPCBM/NEW2 domain-containing protein [Pirellulales bacterium]
MPSKIVPVLAVFLSYVIGGCSISAAEPATYSLETKNLALRLSAGGNIIGIKIAGESAERPMTAETSLADCLLEGEPKVSQLPGGGAEFEKKFIHEAEKQAVTVRERFLPRKDSIRWEIEIIGREKPWTTPIQTIIHWPDAEKSRFWTAWGDPLPKFKGWNDPLRPQFFKDRRMDYGNVKPDKDRDTFVIPLLCLLDPQADLGLSVALSPEDLYLDMDLATTAGGDLTFTRRHHRLEKTNVVRCALDLTAHRADWRSGLDWYARRYPAYFEPPNPCVRQMAGNGGYSSHAEITDAELLMRMAFRVNWKASFDFPYMSMFLPPTKTDADEWTDFKKQKTNVAKMRASARNLRRMGFYEVNYFNITEAGNFYRYPPPPRKATDDADLWKDPNDFLYHMVGKGILPGPDGKPIASWEGCVAMDPGEPVYQDHLVEQARRHIERIPESFGICIDRMDWIHFYNRERDDGRTWYKGRPARSLVNSWHAAMDRIGPMMHAAGKVIYGNPHYARIDLMRHLDGIYDEAGMQGVSLNMCALMGIDKPVMEWTWDLDEKGKGPDAFFQRHLYMGAYLTAPVPGNDHCMLPDPTRERFYLDYGPLFDALRGKRWVLLPHVIRVEGDKALANVFEAPGGFVVPVISGGKEASVTVVLQGLPKLPGQKGFRCEAIQPAEANAVALNAVEREDALRIDVPLKRGCAMLLLNYLWMEPKASYFIDSMKLELGTTLENARLRFTLDGTEPTPQSPSYSAPVELRKTTVVKAAAFRGEKKIGAALERECVKIPPSPPRISPAGGFFDEAVEVTLSSPQPLAGESIHYTLDGTPPTLHSPKYEKPLQIDRSLRLLAVRFTPADASLPAVADFGRRGPKPPQPDVSLVELKPLKATTDWGGHPRMNRSIGDNPLTLGGAVHERGVGVAANSELEYDILPGYSRFVAVIGVDDAMRRYKQGTVVFEIWIDQKCVQSTPVMRPGDYTHVDVPLPAGGKKLRLVAQSTGDGIACDHADWASAGFTAKPK